MILFKPIGFAKQKIIISGTGEDVGKRIFP